MKNDVLGKDIKWMCLAGTGDCLFTRFFETCFCFDGKGGALACTKGNRQ